MMSFVAEMSSQVARGQARMRMPSLVRSKATRPCKPSASVQLAGELDAISRFDGGQIHGVLTVSQRPYCCSNSSSPCHSASLKSSRVELPPGYLPYCK